ncbi:MAG: hypothetical protein ABSE62_03360 [Chthoniobacteraceae bacterium]
MKHVLPALVAVVCTLTACKTTSDRFDLYSPNKPHGPYTDRVRGMTLAYRYNHQSTTYTVPVTGSQPPEEQPGGGEIAPPPPPPPPEATPTPVPEMAPLPASVAPTTVPEMPPPAAAATPAATPAVAIPGLSQ